MADDEDSFRGALEALIEHAVGECDECLLGDPHPEYLISDEFCLAHFHAAGGLYTAMMVVLGEDHEDAIVSVDGEMRERYGFVPLREADDGD